ncbi:MAG TPA: mandelate racemase/muconate lactonizing enzyme family protein [Bryobacterales bacterium]|nr:mandelate racemase/muconate lactonizing enzyme family protein [Bryobacterales bacterium]
MKNTFSRRKALVSLAGGLPAAGWAAARPKQLAAAAAPTMAGLLDTSIKKVDRTWVEVPFRPVPDRNMKRELYQWRYFEICRVTLACGVTGFGEAMVYYGGRPLEDATIARVLGKKAAELMWDDSLGNGLQQALFDAVGKVNDVPIYRLMGDKYRDRAFVSWWAIDMPGKDWVSECKDAVAAGYTDFKTKGRPWFDLDEQCRVLTATLPDHFKIDFDYNAMLLNAAKATPYCTALEKYHHIAIWESPIPQGDVEGNKLLRTKTKIPIAHHFGSPPIMTALREEVCDGFVIGGAAGRVMDNAIVAAAASKPFWLQLVGTGITATFALHLGAVLSHARWPAVNCHQLYTHQMITPGMEVANGTAAIPEGPGLGVQLDEEAVERFRVEPLKKNPYPYPGQLIAIRWPTGATSYYTHTRQYWDDFAKGTLPVFPAGVYMESIPDNGSAEWKDLQARAAAKAVHSAGRPM